MPLGEILNTLHLAQDSIVSPKQAEMMSAVVDEIQGVRCNFCEDGGGVFITSSDGIRCGDCGKKCVTIAPPEEPSEAEPEPTLTDPLDQAFEQECELQNEPEPVPEVAVEVAAPAPDLPEEIFPDVIPEVEQPEEAQPEEVVAEVPQQSAPATVVQEIESFETPRETSATVEEVFETPQPTVSPPPKAFEESASSTVDKDVYTKAEVEHIKQGIADEMMREVEAIMQQTQARNKEVETELHAMQRSYEKLTLTCAQAAVEKNDKVEELQQLTQMTTHMEADLEGKLQAAQRNNQLLHLENERLRTAAESDQRELQEASTAEAEMRSLIGKFQKTEGEMSEQIEMKDRDLLKAKAEWDALTVHAQETLEGANKEVERLSEMIRNSEATNREGDIRLSKTREELAAANSERDDASSKCALLEQNAQESMQRVGDLEEENHKLKLQVADSEATLNGVRKQEKVSRADVEALQKDAMETRTALSTARVELADAKSQLSSVTQKHESASQGTASVSKRLSELEAENKELKLENYELHKKADSAGSSADSSGQVAQLQSELAEKIALIETKEAEKAELQKVCDELFQMVEAKDK